MIYWVIKVKTVQNSLLPFDFLRWRFSSCRKKNFQHYFIFIFQDSLEKALVAKEVLSDLDTSKDHTSQIETIKKEPIESEEIIEYDFANKDDESVSLQVNIKTTWPLLGKMVTQNWILREFIDERLYSKRQKLGPIFGRSFWKCQIKACAHFLG